MNYLKEESLYPDDIDLDIEWYRSGQKKKEVTFIFKKNPESDKILWDQINTYWYENGQKKLEESWREKEEDRGGKLIFHKEWNEDGSVKE